MQGSLNIRQIIISIYLISLNKHYILNSGSGFQISCASVCMCLAPHLFFGDNFNIITLSQINHNSLWTLHVFSMTVVCASWSRVKHLNSYGRGWKCGFLQTWILHLLHKKYRSYSFFIVNIHSVKGKMQMQTMWHSFWAVNDKKRSTQIHLVNCVWMELCVCGRPTTSKHPSFSCIAWYKVKSNCTYYHVPCRQTNKI